MVPTERAVLAALLSGSFHIIRSLRSPAFSARLSFVVKLPCSGVRVVYSYHHKKTSAREAFLWCRQRDSNSRPTDYKSVALPTELCRHLFLEDFIY